MKSVVTVSVLFIVSLLFSMPSPAQAACGSYWGYASEGCVDINYNVIDPYFLCDTGANIGVACCTTYEECPNITITVPPTSPTPGDSTSDCGERLTDPGTGQRLCLGGDGKYIAPFKDCGTQSRVCCKSDPSVQCPAYRCPLTAQERAQGGCIYDPSRGVYSQSYCSTEQPCGTPTPIPTSTPTPNPSDSEGRLSEWIEGKCTGGSEGIQTAFGCISANLTGFFSDLLRIGIGLSGGIAFLMILYGSLLVLSSQGDPKRLEEGKQITAAAVTGLLLILFSVFLLQFLGQDILRAPGFG